MRHALGNWGKMAMGGSKHAKTAGRQFYGFPKSGPSGNNYFSAQGKEKRTRNLMSSAKDPRTKGPGKKLRHTEPIAAKKKLAQETQYINAKLRCWGFEHDFSPRKMLGGLRNNGARVEALRCCREVGRPGAKTPAFDLLGAPTSQHPSTSSPQLPLWIGTTQLADRTEASTPPTTTW